MPDVSRYRVVVVGDGSENTGFAGGCNVGAAKATGDVLVFLNSDAVLRPGALEPLAAAAVSPGSGIVCGCLRLADEPDLVNSVGNPLQFLGLTWAGECGSPARDHLERREVAVATGGFFALSRSTWKALADSPEPCGRKLDFLLQEMNREVNTIGSKADGLRVSNLVISAKAELEKMREQVQNVE